MALGKCSARKLVLRGAKGENQRYLMRIFEELVTKRIYQSKSGNKTGEEVRQCGVLADYNGFSLRQHACLACKLCIIINYQLSLSQSIEIRYRMYGDSVI